MGRKCPLVCISVYRLTNSKVIRTTNGTYRRKPLHRSRLSKRIGVGTHPTEQDRTDSNPSLNFYTQTEGSQRLKKGNILEFQFQPSCYLGQSSSWVSFWNSSRQDSKEASQTTTNKCIENFSLKDGSCLLRLNRFIVWLSSLFHRILLVTRLRPLNPR